MMSTAFDEDLDRPKLLAELQRLREQGEQLKIENEYLLEAQRSLEETRDHYADLYDFAPLAWLTLDGDGGIRSVNLQAAELLGRERQLLLDVALRHLIAHEDRGAFQQHLLASANSRDAVSCELHLATAKSEHPIPARLVTRSTLNHGARGYVMAIVDLREREEAAEERRRLAERERSLREANAAKDQFIAVLSHELRTPLTPVLAAVSALTQRESTPSDLRATFAMMQRNITAEARLIDDLLDVTRITRGKLRVDKRPTDLHQAVRDSVDTLRVELNAKRHTLLLELEASSYWVTGDPIRLRQVFSNLLRNAIKFTPEGGRIELRSWNRDSRVVVEVSDTGRGIEPDELPRLFAPFEQALDETSDTRSGLGLGLAICRGLVSLHGGQIAVHSRGRNQGARVLVELATVAEQRQPMVDRPSTPPPKQTSLRVLLVEDHADTMDVLSELLGRVGFQVQTASSLEAARAVDFGSLDLIVSDLGLGDGSGLDLIRFVRERSQVKAIALSGYGTENDKNATKQAGFDAHVTKPINFDKLLEVIARVCR